MLATSVQGLGTGEKYDAAYSEKVAAALRELGTTVEQLVGGGTPTPVAEPFIIQIGQSNSDGQARAADLPSGYTGVLPNCFIYTPNTNGAFVGLQGGVTSATTGGDNWGPEIAYAPKLAAHLGKRVNIVKYAFGGTALAQGPGDDWNANSTGELLDRSLQLATAARAALSTHPLPLAYVDYQGESDANATNSGSYKANLIAKIAKVRSYWGAAIPYIIVQLSVDQTYLTDRDPTGLGIVRQAQLEVSQEVAGCFLSKTDGEPLDGEHLHLVAAGLINVGNDIGDNLITIADGTAPAVTQPPAVTGDDLVNTITITHRYGVSGTQYRLGDSGAPGTFTATPGYNASTGKIDIGDVNRAEGYLQFRTAADSTSGRTESVWVKSPAFTASGGTTPDPDPTTPNLLLNDDLASAQWNGNNMTVIGGRTDGDGGTTGVLLRPTTDLSDTHNRFSADTNLASGNYRLSIKGLPSGYDFIELRVLDRSTFAIVSSVLVNLSTGQKVNGNDAATVAAVAGGAYRPRLPFSWGGGNVLLAYYVWASADKANYAGDGVKGITVYKPYLEAV